MLMLYSLVLCASALAHVRPLPDLYDLEDAENIFEEFINKYNKVYASEQEKQERFNIFKDNLMEINELRLSEKGKLASFGINHLSDWTKEEFQSTHGLRPGPISSVPVAPVNVTMEVPESFDWRQYNVVTPAKDQGKCGSCWAFSTTGSVEAAYAIKHKQLLSFSEQQMVDCDDIDGGCNGGLMGRALLYLEMTGGIELESDYPYEDKYVKCRFDKSKVKAKIRGQLAYNISDVTATKQLLVKYGPISIAVNAEHWLQYTGGIYDCPNELPGHGVLLVGYGTEKGVPYWLIKSSSGTSWGENGYIRIRQGKNNNNNVCGMTYLPSFIPIVE